MSGPPAHTLSNAALNEHWWRIKTDGPHPFIRDPREAAHLHTRESFRRIYVTPPPSAQAQAQITIIPTHAHWKTTMKLSSVVSLDLCEVGPHFSHTTRNPVWIYVQIFFYVHRPRLYNNCESDFVMTLIYLTVHIAGRPGIGDSLY